MMEAKRALFFVLLLQWLNPVLSWSFSESGRKTRRAFLTTTASSLVILVAPSTARAKCTDIESCREIGERKDAEIQAANPIIRLGDGLQYKVLSRGLGAETVSETSKVKIIYSISRSSGSYMYSEGFGFNKIDVGGKLVSDQGLDSLLVNMKDQNEKQIPVGIRSALLGMRRGEKRRINCPPQLGFETSDWNPQPTDFRGKQQIKEYKSTLYGRGDSQPPYPASTIWDVEVVSIR
jgi:hypothetical protein